MRVSFDTRHGTRTGILKTYDRREGSVSRVLPGSDEHVDYDSSYEGDLMALVSEGEHVPVFDEVIYGYRDPARMDLSTPARQECFFQALRLEEFSNETMAYEALRHLQGDCVPGFYTSMTWTPDCKNGQALMIGAVLIEEIEGAKTLQDFWDDIGDENYEESLLFGYISREEKRVQASVEDAGVFDGDRHAGNTLIVLDNLQQGYIKLIQIDFGFARTGLAEDVLQLERELEELEEELEDSLN
ncbi:hypothetical protein N0V82_005921 [Gnomoniopsis sp. IMI 355080]|nr:hypothetical protein N0V82_005921 [Gnomoniopsis sp. IMI 355080]